MITASFVPDGSNSSSISLNVLECAFPFQSYLGCRRRFSVSSTLRRVAVSLHGPFSKNLAIRKYNSARKEGGTDGELFCVQFILCLDNPWKNLIFKMFTKVCLLLCFSLTTKPPAWSHVKIYPYYLKVTELVVFHH